MDCMFSVDKGDSTSSLNRLGLVNFFGVVGLLVFVPLGICNAKNTATILPYFPKSTCTIK